MHSQNFLDHHKDQKMLDQEKNGKNLTFLENILISSSAVWKGHKLS